MNIAASPNLVHESETQRQHVRVRLEGTLEVDGDGGAVRYPLYDVSVGGAGFTASGKRIHVGETYSGRLNLSLDAITVALPIRFQVKHYDRPTGRAGAAFTDIGPAELAALRRIVTAHLSGEIVGASELMHTLSRNNFTKPRQTQTAAAEARSAAARMRALVLTLIMLSIGVTAFVYVLDRLHAQVFGATAIAARVSGPRYTVAMPREGIFRSLVPQDGMVKKGAPIATFESSMLDLVRGQALDANLTPQQLEALLQRSAKGTISSPCDCRVQATYAADEQYVAKNQPLFDLVPMKFEPFIVARFRYPQAERLAPGTPVNVRISGDAGERQGHVAQIRERSDANELSDDVVAVVETEEPIDPELMYKPVHVSAGGDPMLPRIGAFVSAALAGEKR